MAASVWSAVSWLYAAGDAAKQVLDVPSPTVAATAVVVDETRDAFRTIVYVVVLVALMYMAYRTLKWSTTFISTHAGMIPHLLLFEFYRGALIVLMRSLSPSLSLVGYSTNVVPYVHALVGRAADALYDVVAAAPPAAP